MICERIPRNSCIPVLCRAKASSRAPGMMHEQHDGILDEIAEDMRSKTISQQFPGTTAS